jgi:dTDP-glucose 4,6-dehydratase
MRIVITGGAEFIGSALVRHMIGQADREMQVLETLVYAGNPRSLETVQGHWCFRLSQNRTRRDLSKKRP